jgi:hypothetical protein
MIKWSKLQNNFKIKKIIYKNIDLLLKHAYNINRGDGKYAYRI